MVESKSILSSKDSFNLWYADHDIHITHKGLGHQCYAGKTLSDMLFEMKYELTKGKSSDSDTNTKKMFVRDLPNGLARYKTGKPVSGDLKHAVFESIEDCLIIHLDDDMDVDRGNHYVFDAIFPSKYENALKRHFFGDSDLRRITGACLLPSVALNSLAAFACFMGGDVQTSAFLFSLSGITGLAHAGTFAYLAGKDTKKFNQALSIDDYHSDKARYTAVKQMVAIHQQINK